jgi:hypothetical protein
MSCSMENLDDTEHNPEFFEDERYVFTFMKLNWKHGLLFSSLLQNWESYVHNSLKMPEKFCTTSFVSLSIILAINTIQ